MNNLALMARFNQRVNGHIYDAVAALSDEEYRRDRKAFFGSIHRTLGDGEQQTRLDHISITL